MKHATAPMSLPSAAAQISQLPDMPMTEIKAIWRQLFGKDATVHNRAFLERRIAYKWQEIACRKTDAALLNSNARRIASLMSTGKASTRERDMRPVAGTVLTREYHGQIYQVRVTQDDQYEFDGRLYPSLSMIAREITGTRWSGPLFWGLKAAPKTKKQGGKV